MTGEKRQSKKRRREVRGIGERDERGQEGVDIATLNLKFDSIKNINI